MKLGLVYKKGKFSTAEETIIKEGIERYRAVCDSLLFLLLYLTPHHRLEV